MGPLCPITIMINLNQQQVKVYITRSLFWDNFNPPVARNLLISAFPEGEWQQCVFIYQNF